MEEKEGRKEKGHGEACRCLSLHVLAAERKHRVALFLHRVRNLSAIEHVAPGEPTSALTRDRLSFYPFISPVANPLPTITSVNIRIYVPTCISYPVLTFCTRQFFRCSKIAIPRRYAVKFVKV